MESWDLLTDRTIFFVTHAGTMRPLLKTLLAAESDMMYFSFGNCSHVKVEFRKVNDSIRRVLTDLLTIQNNRRIDGRNTTNHKCRRPGREENRLIPCHWHPCQWNFSVMRFQRMIVKIIIFSIFHV